MIADSLIMIRPASFGFNPETALSNSFQSIPPINPATIQQDSLIEFEGFLEALLEKEVDVKVFNDIVVPIKPDAVFLNNWFSTHSDGTVILYPMFSPLRRAERRQDIIDWMNEKYDVKRFIDLSPLEKEGKILEGTGSLVFDHDSNIVYANTSNRTNEQLVKIVAKEFDCEPIIFKATDTQNNDLYHTNVVMNIGDGLAVVCLECITENRDMVELTLARSSKQVVEISIHQMENFAGNMLMVKNKSDKKFIAMSTRAQSTLSATQLSTIEKHASIIHADLSTIEKVGGGSARCMLAENFLRARI